MLQQSLFRPWGRGANAPAAGLCASVSSVTNGKTWSVMDKNHQWSQCPVSLMAKLGAWWTKIINGLKGLESGSGRKSGTTAVAAKGELLRTVDLGLPYYWPGKRECWEVA